MDSALIIGASKDSMFTSLSIWHGSLNYEIKLCKSNSSLSRLSYNEKIIVLHNTLCQFSILPIKQYQYEIQLRVH